MRMAYQALYRTYRPKDFDEVAGQEHITKTFKNALLHNKIAHAYLFSGPRGTGKTSIAKIIAKAVNCEHAPVSNPCNTCDVCKGIDQNTIHDVIEIDAASNNGVDEIREIRDKVKYLPSAGKYKVYIIDEVHMLSTGAFNALLKTLEEPPKHVIFILATTEPHKIPATIHSRCQRFDFRGIGIEEMIEKLHEIITKEGIKIDEDAVQLIAESAEGGMRDAIGLLDQVTAYNSNQIGIDDVHAIRGSISHDDIIAIAQAIEANNVVKAMDILDTLIAKGKESQKLLDDFIKFYRDVLMIKNTNHIEPFKVLHQHEAFRTLIEHLGNERVFYYIDVLHDTQQKMRFAGNAKLYLELAFLKMVDQEMKKEAIALEKLSHLESEYKGLKSQIELLEETIKQSRLEPSKDALEEARIKSIFSEDSEDELEKQEESDELVQASTDDSNHEEPVVKKPSIEAHEPLEPQSEKDRFAIIYNRYSKKRYKTFDIHFVEDVLHTGDREIKIDMVKKWFDIERYVDADTMKYAKMITEGTLVATNGVMLIVTYDSVVMCNRLMAKEIKEKLEAILGDYFKRRIMFMALPNSIWENVQNEFVKKFRQKKESDEFIHLTPINHPKLVEIPTEEENFEDVESDSLKEAKDLFGDIVKVKKGE
jgi:DNA polymerase-3 subunit gamma/tau